MGRRIMKSTPKARRCKDCVAAGITTKRVLATKADGSLQPGPRCVTHYRAARMARSARAHELRVEAVYELSGEEYWAIYRAQGGRCYMCRRATGKRKRLAVDHDHNCPENWNNKPDGHDPKMGCRKCIRCLACGPCNQVLGHLDADGLRRAVEVQEKMPAQQVLASMAKGRAADGD